MNITIMRAFLPLMAAVVLVGATAANLWAQESSDPGIEPLIEQLGSEDVFEINAAVKALTEIGSPAVQPLIATFDSDSWHLVDAAITALTGIGEPAIPALLDALKSESPRVRWTAAYALRRDILFESLAYAEDVHYALLDTLDDPDPRVRRFAAETLWKQNDENSVLAFRGSERYQSARDLIEKLHNDDEAVRLEALRALTQMAKAQSLEAEGDAVSFLTDALGDSEAAVRRIAAFTLGQMGEDSAMAIPELLRALDDPDPSVRATAAKALGAIGKTASGAIEKLHGMLEDGSEEVRGAAAIALADLGALSERVVVELREELTDIDEDKREVAALELGSAGELAGVAVPELRELMGDLSPEVRRAAALALGRIGEWAMAAVPELTKGLSDKDATVRADSAQALGEMGKAAAVAVPALRKTLTDRDPSVRAHAARTLGQIGFEADDVIPELSRLLEDENQMTRKFSAQALARISVSIREEAKRLSSKELGQSVADLETARQGLEAAAATDRENQLSYRNALATVGLSLDALYTEQYGFLYSITENKWLSALVAYLVLLPAFWWLLLWLRPLWLFHINHALEPYEFAAPRALSEKNRFKTRYAILVGFYYFHPRVLDAWVQSQLPIIRSSLAAKLALDAEWAKKSLPVEVNGEVVPSLTTELLRSTFSRQPSCLLIWGEPGDGKDDLVDRVATMAMEEEEGKRLAEQPMIPIFIEQELVTGSDKEEKGKKKEPSPPPLPEVVRGQLQNLTRSSQPLSQDVVLALLRRPSILLIVPELSQKSGGTREQIRPDLPDFPANALVVSSRLEEPLGQVMKTTVRPRRFGADQYAAALKGYAAWLGKEALVDETSVANAARQFAGILGKYQVPVLIAKLHADRTIAVLEGGRDGRDELDDSDRPDNVPELLFSYLNEINPSKGKSLDTETVYATVRVVAWECVKQSLRPLSAKQKDILAALGDDATGRLKYLLKPLSLIEIVGATGNRYRFTSEFLAKHFAAMHLAETYAGDEQAWHGLLQHADEIPGSPGSIRDFLLALRASCRTAERQVPAFLASELEWRIEGKEPPERPSVPEQESESGSESGQAPEESERT